ncbi:MAG: pilus (MSHA type) biogenesis protein MshL [Proteobacteria bacterium]|nr:pilus (MSHA type) biogenesis protein MshL [Pseudomonadota bacterium]MBU4029217.1 pilus (MSHA type) biogenesis protein MshL [Pseudomonadota bacterium]MBU4043946.1 pilus (MSHA type) biogenesis protein MshL [Pseudomonadota bacterium]
MKLRSKVASTLALFLLSLVLLSCSPLTAEPEKPTAEAAKVTMPDATPPSLPVQYMKPSYRVDAASKNELDSQADDVVFKVGRTISSKKKVPLSLIMKPLAAIKKLNISWADDVKQDILVDVDIQANDDFYKAIDNILRQLDYFYEIDGSTIVIKSNETKQYHVAMPFSKQEFSTGTGGNVLGGDIGGEGVAKNVEGTIKLVSEKNEFDIWENIKSNLDSILDIKRTRTRIETDAGNSTDSTNANATGNAAANQNSNSANVNANLNAAEKKEKALNAQNVIQEGISVTSKKDSYYFIDKPVGLITVSAPRTIQKQVEDYFTSLQKEIYKQVSIEAKIIEVQLVDNSSIGINWESVLKSFSIKGAVEFGAQTLGNGVTSVGQVFPYVFANENAAGTWNDGTNHGSTYDPTRFVSNIRINTANFEVFLNALKTQGTTKVLSNPKISVLNGQPSMITVGQNITYIDKIEVDVDATTGVRTYSATTARVLSGVGLALTATVLDNNEIIMNLVPVTSELAGEIEYRAVGEGTVGLPVVNVREMSTTVRVKDGEMLVIGGLISDVNDEQGNFAPVLGDIPLVKYLFGYEEKIKNKRELIILLKPRII